MNISPAAVAAPSRLPGTARPRALWRSVAVPTEHGGWGLTFEPVLLGLIVAPSWAGAAIGAAAMLAFVARTPAKIVLVDRWRHRSLPRTRVAMVVAAAEIAVLVALLGVAAAVAAGPYWIPLAVAAPLVVVELWFDMRSRSRRLVPELAGTAGIGGTAAAIALAANGSAVLAAGAWLVIVARAVASLPFVRFQLRRVKHQPHRRWAQDLAHGRGPRPRAGWDGRRLVAARRRSCGRRPRGGAGGARPDPATACRDSRRAAARLRPRRRDHRWARSRFHLRR